MKGFDEYDEDRSGSVDADEFARGEEGKRLRAAEEMKGLDEDRAEKKRSHAIARKEFSTVDTDRDGKISKAEWKVRYGSLKGFDEYDKNGDNVVDAEEFSDSVAKERTLEASTKAFVSGDKDKDEQMSKSEWKVK